MSENIINQVNAYYTKRISEFGATPKGVDWNGEDSQYMRFSQLMKIADGNNEPFSLLDFGCGYGGMIDYLKPIYGKRFNYFGFDISEEMIKAAKIKYNEGDIFFSKIPDNFQVDFVVASGLFNVRQDISNGEWWKYITQTLDQINSLSRLGFSFNILTSYSDSEHMKEYLYYAKPEQMFEFCKVNYSKHVALLHDYPLYEFTLLVKK